MIFGPANHNHLLPFIFMSISVYFANTLALTPFPLEDRFNLWFGPILVQRR